MKNHIVISIQYAGLMLPVNKTEDGDFVRLKLISDGVGLKWQDQRKKILNSDWQRRRLGVLMAENTISGMACHTSNSQNTPENDDSGKESLISSSKNTSKNADLFIRLDRVAAYLSTINPDQVRSQGNIPAADFLEAKISEWDDALHDYEDIGVAHNLNHVRQQDLKIKSMRLISYVIAIKNKTEPLNDRQLLEHMIADHAKETGYPYQPDLLDKPSS
jgi:hypothetical protein